MRRYGLIFFGILLFTAGLGVLAWRVQTNPGLLERYERALTGQGEKVAPHELSTEAPSDGRSGTFGSQELEDDRVGALKLNELFIDLANVLIGLIGIGLAVSGMRARGRAPSA